MASYTKAFSSYGSCGSSSIPSTCCNSTSPPSTSQGASIFDDLDPSVVTTADAMGSHVDNLRRRLAAKATIVSTSASTFSVKLIRGSRTDNLAIQVGANGQYPIIVTYSTPIDSGEANLQFWSAIQFVDYFVEALR